MGYDGMLCARGPNVWFEFEPWSAREEFIRESRASLHLRYAYTHILEASTDAHKAHRTALDAALVKLYYETAQLSRDLGIEGERRFRYTSLNDSLLAKQGFSLLEAEPPYVKKKHTIEQAIESLSKALHDLTRLGNEARVAQVKRIAAELESLQAGK